MFLKSVKEAKKRRDQYKAHRVGGIAGELTDLYSRVMEDRDMVEEARCNPIFCSPTATQAEITAAHQAAVEAKKKLEASENLLRLTERLARRISPEQFSWL